MDKQWKCAASAEKYTSYANAARKRPDGTIQCPVCGKVVKLRKQGLDVWPTTLPYHHDERGKSRGRGSSYPILPGRKIGTKLVPVPATQPPSASGERERAAYFLRRFKSEERMLGPNEQEAIDVALAALAPSPGIDAAGQKPKLPWPWESADQVLQDAIVYIDGQDRLKDALRALIAQSSPGIDAAEQKPVAWLTSDGKMLVFADKISNGRAQHSGMTPLYAAPPAAQPSAEWLAEAFRLLDDYRDAVRDDDASYGLNYEPYRAECRAALLAHLKARP